MTFSNTDIVSKLRTTWNVRAIPAIAQATGPVPETRVPRRRISPASGVISPEIKLNSEVLPAPFGPIRPRISPSRTSNDISTLAATPPNDLLTRSISSRGVSDIDIPVWAIARASEGQGSALDPPRGFAPWIPSKGRGPLQSINGVCSQG